jgi:p-hydroxybenzoate 3-monooxygenase
VFYLYEALLAYYRQGASGELDGYSQRALRRVWQSVRFSWWMTSLLHHFPDEDTFTTHIRRSELEYVYSSTAAQAVLAENYVGLPL